jgi:hypothetical protein
VYENDGHLYQATLFSNPGIRNRMGIMFGGGNIFGLARYENVRHMLLDIKLTQIVEEEGIKSKEQMSAIMGFAITGVEYGKLRDAVKYVRNKYKPNWELRDTGKTIDEWMEPIKKGSNKFRCIMSGRGSKEYRNFKFENIRPINTLWAQMGIDKDDNLIGCGMLLWNVKEIDTEFRQYIFKWNQGMVHGNTVISHFGDVDRKCTFCKIRKVSERKNELGRDLDQNEVDAIQIDDEARPHIFWACPIVSECIQNVYRNVWNTDRDIDKKSFLMGRDMGCMEASMLYMLVNMYIKYRIWKYKLANVEPKAYNIANDTKLWIQDITWYNKWRIMLPLVRQRIRMV